MSASINLLASQIESEDAIVLPARLKLFFDDAEWLKYEGLVVSELPFFASDSRSQISFADRERLRGNHEYSEEMPGFQSGFWPLCHPTEFDGSFYFAVDLSNTSLPVFFFDYEEGFKQFCTSFDVFLKSLLAPGEKTKADKLSDLFDQAKDLFNADEYQQCINLVETQLPDLAGIKLDNWDQNKELPEEVRNILALAYKNVGQFEKALNLFEVAIEGGSKNAVLNVLSIYIDRKEYRQVVERGDTLSRKLMLHWSDYHAFYSWLYRGLARLHLGEYDEARRLFSYIGVRFSENRERIDKAIEELSEVEGEARPFVERQLLWLQRLFPECNDDEKQAALSWWDGLDDNVQALMLKNMDIDEGDPSAEQLLSLWTKDKLKLDHAELSSLDFLMPFKRLRNLSASGNEIADIKVLENFTGLRELDLNFNSAIEDYSSLAKLVRLEKLSLNYSEITDIGPLGALKNLRKLDLSDNEIKDIGPICGLAELVELDICSNEIVDINALASCKLLKEVECDDNPLEDRGVKSAIELLKLPLLSRLEGSWDEDACDKEELKTWAAARPWVKTIKGKELDAWIEWWNSLSDSVRNKLDDDLDPESDDKKSLGRDFKRILNKGSYYLSETALTDVSVLNKLYRADHLSLRDNGIGDISGLSSLQCLRGLDLDRNQLRDLQALESFPYLAMLSLAENGIESLASLPPMPSLRNLDLSKNSLSSLEALVRVPGLRCLKLAGNQISSLAGIEVLKELRQLEIEENAITDLSPLAACENLETVFAYGDHSLTGLMALADLPFLHELRLLDSADAQEVELFSKARPEVSLL